MSTGIGAGGATGATGAAGGFNGITLGMGKASTTTGVGSQVISVGRGGRDELTIGDGIIETISGAGTGGEVLAAGEVSCISDRPYSKTGSRIESLAPYKG